MKGKRTLCLIKKDPRHFSRNLGKRYSILIIFGANVSQKAGN